MSVINKDLGVVTAYAYAVEAGYTGTEEEFEQALGDLAELVTDFDNFRVEVTTLAPGSSATASYADGVLSLGIPEGEKGDTGATPNLTIGTVTTLAPGSDATATITGTAEAPVLSLGIPEGDPGEVPAAALASEFSASVAYKKGDYVWRSGTLYEFTADHAAGAWTGTDATTAKVADDVADLKSALNYVDGNIVPGGYTSINGLYVNASTGNIAAATGTSDLYLLVFPCKAGTKYRIKKQTSTIMRASSGAVAAPSSGTTGHLLGAHTTASSAEIVGTTGASDTYLYVQLYANADPANMRSVDVNIKTLIIYEDAVGELLDTMTEQGAQWEV